MALFHRLGSAVGAPIAELYSRDLTRCWYEGRGLVGGTWTRSRLRQGAVPFPPGKRWAIGAEAAPSLYDIPVFLHGNDDGGRGTLSLREEGVRHSRQGQRSVFAHLHFRHMAHRGLASSPASCRRTLGLSQNHGNGGQANADVGADIRIVWGRRTAGGTRGVVAGGGPSPATLTSRRGRTGSRRSTRERLSHLRLPWRSSPALFLRSGLWGQRIPIEIDGA